MGAYSIYLNDELANRLARLARAEGRPQAEIVRDAISRYQLAPKRNRNFALAGNFARIDSDSQPFSGIPENELMRGFGAREADCRRGVVGRAGRRRGAAARGA